MTQFFFQRNQNFGVLYVFKELRILIDYKIAKQTLFIYLNFIKEL